ncbi:hypothetical protein DIPPA_22215 [Diplonema papillatum]|nr:hypothetical protein DIPPA_22215 [Diplonema papillatum]
MFASLARCKEDRSAATLRQQVAGWLRNNDEYRGMFCPEDERDRQTYDEYLDHMEERTTYGDHWCLQAAAEILDAAIRVLDAAGSRKSILPSQRHPSGEK